MIIRNKKIFILLILGLIVALFFVFFYRKKIGQWSFEKDSYSMNIILYQDIFGKLEGSYCFISPKGYNCPFKKNKEGEWDTSFFNIKKNKGNEYFIMNNRKENEQDLVLFDFSQDLSQLHWKREKAIYGNGFDIPYDIILNKIKK